jgi:hypothetical protein
MSWLRTAGAVVLVVAGLIVVTNHATQSSQTFPVAVPCNASAISAPYTGPFTVRSVQSFGCVGQWAYLWATVGKGVQEIGVTEIVHYEPATLSWHNASRLHYCVKHRLPRYVQYWGCNSN